MPSPANSSSTLQVPAVITAMQRWELARQFERAKQLAKQDPPDYAGVHQVLAECCTLDPGNTLFVQALLENLQRAKGKTAKGWPWQVWSMRSAFDLAIRENRNSVAIARGWSLLGERPQDVSILIQLAEICDQLDHQQTQLLLLQTAQQWSPQDPAVLKPLQAALSGAGQFAAAGVLRGDIASEHSIPAAGGDLVGAVEQALAQGRWDVAEELLSERSGALGANLRLRELGEELMLGRAREKTRLAEEQAVQSPIPRHQQLVAEVREEQWRIELGVAFARYERFPSEPARSWELAQCLNRVGNYSEALKYLSPLHEQPVWRVQSLIASGENWQQLRQFERALELYRAAISGASEVTVDEHQQKAWYRGAVLAEALGHRSEALEWFESLVAADPAYKDAAARLDKLSAVCDKGEFSAQPARKESL